MGGLVLSLREIGQTDAAPAPVFAALERPFPSLLGPDMPAAVRSSATAEDRADASFAGQYATVLGARGLPAVQSAILTCWRSFYSA